MNLPRLAMQALLGRRLPVTSGSIRVPGIESEIVVRRDEWGIPQIEAGSEPDAWYGLGFCQGQDRAFQLESTLRVVRGTLSEVIGADGLQIDRLSRRIGFARSARRHLEVIGREQRARLDAFVAGINAGMSAGCRRRPHEFVLLRARPSRWEAADVLGFLKLTSFLLATNWDVELARLKILTEDGPEALSALEPEYPEWQPVIVPPGLKAGPALDRLAADLEAFLAFTGAGGGSNNWAIAGERTASGRPILANDPHLSPALPPHWYLVRIRTPEWSVAGATFVGGPTIAAGHNGFVAWGVTVGMTDNTDLFLEEIGPDGRSVRQGEEYVPCEVHTEPISIRGRAVVVEEVLETPRGPIISPALGDTLSLPSPQGGEGLGVRGFSMRATWLDPLPIRGLLDVHHTRSFEDFRDRLADWPALPLNVGYADSSGTIGWQLMGTAPRRRRGHGMLPLPGWEPGAGWEDEHVPHREMPYVVNPEVGFVATSNNKAAPDGVAPFLTTDWIEGYRAARIVEMLERRRDWDLSACTMLQMDQECVPWRELRETVLAAPVTSDDGRLARDLLREWDGVLAADSPAAAVYELFVAEMCATVARAKAPKGWRYALGEGFHPLAPGNSFAARRVGQLARLLRERPEGWLERSWDEEIAAALDSSIARLRAGRGPDRGRWAWGQVRMVTLTHPVGEQKRFDRIYNLGPIPLGGDSNTPAQAGVSPLDPTRNPGFIQSLRMVVDVGAWDNSRWILPGGQSGNPLSPHYADQFPLWISGEGIPIPWSDEAVERATVETLRLVPQDRT